MNRHFFLTLFIFTLNSCQLTPVRPGAMPYEPSAAFPFGRPNPNAPTELQQFAFLIGNNDCSEERLDGASGEWIPGVRIWDAHYYLNGNAIRDGGRSGSSTNGNIRIYDPATEQWHVTYFSTPVYGSGTWKGKLIDNRIELEQPQLAPGTTIEGINRLTFYNISSSSFDWRGEWVSLDGSQVFPYWRVSCEKLVN